MSFLLGYPPFIPGLGSKQPCLESPQGKGLSTNSQQITEAFSLTAHKDQNAANNHLSLESDPSLGKTPSPSQQ